jgi:phosphatidylglycerol:prolipoprotein diacylglycerol transferase
MVIGLALGRVGCFLNGCCYGGFCETMPPGMTFPAQSPPYQRQKDLGWESGVWLASAKREATTMKPLETREHASGAADAHASVRIAYIAPGSSAERTDLEVGEVVEAINGQQVTSLAQAQELLAAASGRYELKLADGKIVRWTSSGPPARSAPVHPAQLYAAIDAGLLAWVLWNIFPYRRRDGEVFALMLTIHPISRFLLEMIRSDEPGQFGTELTISQWMSLGFLVVAGVLWWYLERGSGFGVRGSENRSHEAPTST